MNLLCSCVSEILPSYFHRFALPQGQSKGNGEEESQGTRDGKGEEKAQTDKRDQEGERGSQTAD